MSSCPYKFIFGIPGQGFHSIRFLGYAVNDTLGTVGLALLTSWIFNINIWISLLVWFISGELLHYTFGVQTAFLSTIGVKAC
jgi:hypothetical protein